jgi:hypothetical protein
MGTILAVSTELFDYCKNDASEKCQPYRAPYAPEELRAFVADAVARSRTLSEEARRRGGAPVQVESS